jgi:hypothetical protein
MPEQGCRLDHLIDALTSRKHIIEGGFCDDRHFFARRGAPPHDLYLAPLALGAVRRNDPLSQQVSRDSANPNLT